MFYFDKYNDFELMCNNNVSCDPRTNGLNVNKRKCNGCLIQIKKLV